MLWHVAESNLWLLGSVHSAREALSLSSAAAAALRQAETVAFETNFEVQVSMPAKFYGLGDQLRDQVPAALYEDAKALAERLGLHVEYLATCRPWWAAFELMNSVLADRGYKPDNGIDWQALEIVSATGKAKFFLESCNAGLVPFARAPQSEQQAALAQIVQQTDEGIEMVDAIIAAWVSGIPANLEPLYRRALSQMPNAYAGALDGRNEQWIRHLLRLAGSGRKTVAVVGVMHFSGPNSIPNLLVKAGRFCRLVK